MENRDLKELVLQQRHAGRRAFYYHLFDAEIAGGRALFDTGLRTILPAVPEVGLSPDDPEVAAAIQALQDLAQARRQGAGKKASAALRFDAYFSPLPAQPGRAPPQADVTLACDLLDAVGETVAMAPLEVRAAEAVRLLEHLLATYGLSGERYALALTSLPPRGIQALEKIRLIGAPGVRGGLAWG